MGESTARLIVRVVGRAVISGGVALSTATKLWDDEKLEVLRRFDQFRQWPSLEEERYCLVCGKLITGRQVQVAGGIRGNGRMRLSCPTQDCNSIPMDWVLTTDEILANVGRLAAEERKASASKPAAVTNGNGKTAQPANQNHNFLSRLLKFAFRSKGYS